MERTFTWTERRYRFAAYFWFSRAGPRRRSSAARPMTAAWAAFQLWSSPLCVVLADDLLFPAIPVDDQLGLRRHPT